MPLAPALRAASKDASPLISLPRNLSLVFASGPTEVEPADREDSADLELDEDDEDSLGRLGGFGKLGRDNEGSIKRGRAGEDGRDDIEPLNLRE